MMRCLGFAAAVAVAPAVVAATAAVTLTACITNEVVVEIPDDLQLPGDDGTIEGGADDTIDDGAGDTPPPPPDDDDPPPPPPPDDDDPPPPPPPSEDPVIPENPACANGALDAPIDGCEPAPLPSTGDFHVDCVARINQLRYECQCLPPLARWTDGESCADSMAASDHDSGDAHGGFSSGLCDGGFAQNECPGWDSAEQCVEGCLQMMWDEGPGSFFGGHGHYVNMTSSDYSRVACGVFDGNNGAWSVQNFE